MTFLPFEITYSFGLERFEVEENPFKRVSITCSEYPNPAFLVHCWILSDFWLKLYLNQVGEIRVAGVFSALGDR